MILAETSVWVDHLRVGDKTLSELLDQGLILVHPFVIDELALGRLRQRHVILEAVSELPKANVADNAEVLAFIGRHALFGRGIGYIDVHLLASGSIDRRRWALDARQPAAPRRRRVGLVLHSPKAHHGIALLRRNIAHLHRASPAIRRV